MRVDWRVSEVGNCSANRNSLNTASGILAERSCVLPNLIAGKAYGYRSARLFYQLWCWEPSVQYSAVWGNGGKAHSYRPGCLIDPVITVANRPLKHRRKIDRKAHGHAVGCWSTSRPTCNQHARPPRGHS
ncbi:hypothetical protein GCM10022226_24130 [Sphaerisporangium flaviroseum]|uniref:Uncharacterized protein n=1 Tax=Sphaerisporangium flaviroseum TaxID=509199 RepID=A0ABP7I0Z3_9ACTN